MKKYLNLSIVATLVITAMSCQSALATDMQTDKAAPLQRDFAVDSNKVIELKDGSKVREMVNNQQRSLYQIALLSSISIEELRSINAGRYDKKDVVEVGQLLVLPEGSPLLPEIVKTDSKKEDKYANLPKLGSDDNYDVKKDKSAEATQVASVLQTLASQDWKQMAAVDSGGLSGQLKNKGQDYAEDYVRSGVKNQVVDPVRSAAQDFLGRFGTAQLQFDVSDEGQFNNVNVKLFSPWYDSDNTLLFSQLTFQEYEHNRRIGNFGIGQRFDVADNKWLLGYNVFFDHDFQRSHNRLGIGAEAWTDYMKFASNYYYPLSDWKNSRDFDDYLERAAKGFDVRFQGYLPQYPHLGGSLMYEQYFGDKVALFGKDNLQKDPHAVTVGVDYTPVPLFTVKAEHKRGEESNKATKAELTMNYRLGTPLKDQLDPDMVQVARSLRGSRYDLVDRNNYIVLEYKEKKFTVDLGLETLQLIEGHTYGLSIGLHNAKGLSSLSWAGNMLDIDKSGGFFCFTTGTCTASSWVTPRADVNNWKIVAPNYVDDNGDRLPISTNGKYTLAVTATDSRGKTATSNPVTFEVVPDKSLRQLAVYAVDNSSSTQVRTDTIANHPADGKTAVTLMGSLVQPNNPNNPITSETDVKGFHDAAVFSSTDAIFENVKKNWTATRNGKKIELVNGSSVTRAATSCPSEDPCVIVTSFEKVKKGDTVSTNSATGAQMKVDGDTYTMDVASNVSGLVEFKMALEPYGASFSTAKVNFVGGLAAYVEIYDESGAIVATGNSGRAEVPAPNLYIGKKYYAKAFDDSNGAPLETGTGRGQASYTWSLVAASTDPARQCPTFSYAPPELVTGSGVYGYAVGVGSSVSDKPAYPTMYIPKDKLLNSEMTSKGACSGDQGFKLQIVATVN